MSQKHSDAAVMLLKLDAALPTAEIPPPPPPPPAVLTGLSGIVVNMSLDT